MIDQSTKDMFDKSFAMLDELIAQRLKRFNNRSNVLLHQPMLATEEDYEYLSCSINGVSHIIASTDKNMLTEEDKTYLSTVLTKYQSYLGRSLSPITRDYVN